MAAKVGSVIIDVSANTAKLQDGMNKAQHVMSKSVSKMKVNLKALGAAFAVVGGVAGIAGTVKSSLDAADAMGELSEKLAISTESLSKLSYAAQFSGVQLGTLTAGMSAMIRRTNNFVRSGGGAAKKALEELGISAKFAREHFTDTDTTFRIIINRLSKMPEGFRKTAIAQDIFSKSASSIVAMSNLSAKELLALEEQAKSTGNVIGEEFAQQAGDLNDRIDTLSKSFTGVTNTLAQDLLPTALKVARAFERMLGIQSEYSMGELNSQVVSLSKDWQKLNNTINDHSWKRIFSSTTMAKNEMAKVEKQLLSLSATMEKINKKDIPGGAFVSAKNPPKNKSPKLHNMEDAHVKEYERMLEFNKKQKDDFYRTTLSKYQYQKYILGQQYTEDVHYSQNVEQLNTTLALKLKAIDTQKIEDATKLTNKLQSIDNKRLENVTLLAKKMKESFETNFTDKFTESLVKGKLDFKSFATSILQDMARIAIRQQIAAPLARGLASFLPFAKGGAFSNGTVQPFASGGVVDQPTFFNHSGGMGVMGEAGTEAIMPLTRTSGGDLGVKVTGGGGNQNVQHTTAEINFNVTAIDSASFNNYLVGNRQTIENIINRSLMTNGPVRQTIKQVI